MKFISSFLMSTLVYDQMIIVAIWWQGGQLFWFVFPTVLGRFCGTVPVMKMFI